MLDIKLKYTGMLGFDACFNVLIEEDLAGSIKIKENGSCKFVPNSKGNSSFGYVFMFPPFIETSNLEEMVDTIDMCVNEHRDAYMWSI